MRQIVLDTETTGLDPRQGHRIIEIACLELVNRRLTGRHLHKYVNPEREIDAGAAAVHGITLDFLADKPRFADVAEEFLEFITGAELVIHNAPFDVGFLNAELDLLGRVPVETVCAGVRDTLRMAKELHPGKRNSLDALCDRFEVDRSNRTLHGALIDCELLGEVYLSMTRGQNSLLVDAEEVEPEACDTPLQFAAYQGPLKVVQASAEELESHPQSAKPKRPQGAR
jgi:DNA polymerase-3 subunit epsilon